MSVLISTTWKIIAVHNKMECIFLGILIYQWAVHIFLFHLITLLLYCSTIEPAFYRRILEKCVQYLKWSGCFYSYFVRIYFRSNLAEEGEGGGGGVSKQPFQSSYAISYARMPCCVYANITFILAQIKKSHAMTCWWNRCILLYMWAYHNSL